MNALRNRLGFALRESGQALERLGCRFQGINSFEEECKPAYPTCCCDEASGRPLEESTADCDMLLRSNTHPSCCGSQPQSAKGRQHQLDRPFSTGVGRGEGWRPQLHMVQLHSARYDTQGSALVWQSSFSSSATASLTMPVYRQCCKGV